MSARVMTANHSHEHDTLLFRSTSFETLRLIACVRPGPCKTVLEILVGNVRQHNDDSLLDRGPSQ